MCVHHFVVVIIIIIIGRYHVKCSAIKFIYFPVTFRKQAIWNGSWHIIYTIRMLFSLSVCTLDVHHYIEGTTLSHSENSVPNMQIHNVNLCLCTWILFEPFYVYMRMGPYYEFWRMDLIRLYVVDFSPTLCLQIYRPKR